MSKSPQTSERHAVRSLLAAFVRQREGSVAIIFGLVMMGMCLMIGGAVDLGRWLNTRDKTIAAIDAAVLAAGRAKQTGASDSDAIALAMKVYNSNVRGRPKVIRDTVGFEVGIDGSTILSKGEVRVNTPFMSFARVNSLPLFTASEAPKAVMAQELYRNYHREIVLMLDVSGSMCDPCTKLSDMKVAAKDLVNIVMRNNATSTFKARVGVVPFSGDVRPPSNWLSQVINPASPPTRTYTTGSGWKMKTYTYYRGACVGERTGASRYNNDAPLNKWLLPAYNSSSKSSQQYCETPATGEVLPLSDDKTAIDARITGLTKGGGTAGQVGTAWAYYLLSPSWASALVNNVTSVFGAADVKKIAVLMTDGEYNFERDSNGVDTDDNGAGGSANGQSSAQQAVEICQQMKLSGIEVYTVGFDLGGNQTAINTMTACASSASHAYITESGEGLKAAFRDIAIKASELYVAN